MVMIRIKDEYVCVMSITADVEGYSIKDNMCPPASHLETDLASLIRKSGACQLSPSCASARTYERAQLR